jgi:succinoglycan biosynthesis protein ExoA
VPNSPSAKPHVSVVLPCRNEAGAIEGCLASLLGQQAPEGGFEVIIADGMSEDGTRQIVEKVESRKQKAESGTGSGPAIRVIDNPGKIVSTGLNAAIRAARGDIIIRMDAHTEYAPDYIRRCVETLRETGAENAGGPWVAKGEGYISRAIAKAFQSPFAVGGARSHSSEYEGLVDSVYLGCWRRETFERFGYFDEELVRNQDDEHNLRVVRGGGKVWQSPDIRSWYQPRGSLSALFRQYLQYGYWKVRVIQKHKLPASWRHLVPGAFVLTLLCLFLLSTFSFLASSVGSRWSVVLLALLVGLYAFLASVASIATAAKSEWKLLPVLPFVFGCYHFGYGWGFLRGVLDFVVLRKRPGGAWSGLTRASTQGGGLKAEI